MSSISKQAGCVRCAANVLDVLGQRFMVSPDGREAQWVYIDEIDARAPGWTDCTDVPDGELGKLMERRMWVASARPAKRLSIAA